MPSAFDIIGVVLGIISVSELLKIALRFIAGRLPSGRREKVENSLEKIDLRLRQLERDSSQSLSEQGIERQEINQLIRRLDDLSQDVEDWEERGIIRYFDYSAVINLLRRCSELENSAAYWHMHLQHQVQEPDINAPVSLTHLVWTPANSSATTAASQRQRISGSPLKANTDRAPGLVASSDTHLEPYMQSSKRTWSPDPAIRPPLPQSTRSHQVYNDGPRVTSGVEPSYPAHRVPQSQSWATRRPNPTSYSSLPPFEAQQLYHRAAPSASHQRQQSEGSSQETDTDLEWDENPSYHARGTREKYIVNPAFVPQDHQAEHLIAPMHGSPGLFGPRSPHRLISEDMPEVPDDLEPLEPRSPTRQ